MIAWLLANRTVAEVVIAALLVAGGYGAWIHHDATERRIGITQCMADVAHAVDQQRKQQQEKDERYAQEAKDADEKRVQDIASVSHVTTPVFLCQRTPQVRPNSLPVSGIATGGVNNSASGGPIDRSQRDLRPYINAVELKYETALGACHSIIEKWQAAAAP